VCGADNIPIRTRSAASPRHLHRQAQAQGVINILSTPRQTPLCPFSGYAYGILESLFSKALNMNSRISVFRLEQILVEFKMPQVRQIYKNNNGNYFPPQS
jgi:hypothetical protein